MVSGYKAETGEEIVADLLVDGSSINQTESALSQILTDEDLALGSGRKRYLPVGQNFSVASQQALFKQIMRSVVVYACHSAAQLRGVVRWTLDGQRGY
jgi:hypothetical protein